MHSIFLIIVWHVNEVFRDFNIHLNLINADNLIALQNYKQNTFLVTGFFRITKKKRKRELNKGTKYNLHITLKKRIGIEVFHEIFVTVFYLLRLNGSLAAWQDYNAVNRDNGTDGISSLFLHSLWKWPQFSPAFQTHIIVTQGWQSPNKTVGT